MSAPVITATSTQGGAGTPTTAGGSMRHGGVTAIVCLALAAVVAAMSSLNVAVPP